MIIQFHKRKIKYAILVSALILLYLFGGFEHLFEKNFDQDFDYPYNGNVNFLVDQMMKGAQFTPENKYYFEYKNNCSHICGSFVKLLFLVKSSPENYSRRDIIRRTWGSGRQFAENIKIVFLLGERSSETEGLTQESNKFRDLLQGNFSDTYFNNTIKTMMGFTWAYEYCSNTTEYFMFVDDDYYVSPGNVLEFVKNPLSYPAKSDIHSSSDFNPDKFELYAGHVILSSPFRSHFSKWYVSLQEYPYNKWPPYVTAGAYVLSRIALKRMYHASSLTLYFRLDDIYIGILALKLHIEPIHNDSFLFYKLPYDYFSYRKIIAAHGFDDPEELWKVWNKGNTNF